MKLFSLNSKRSQSPEETPFVLDKNGKPVCISIEPAFNAGDELQRLMNEAKRRRISVETLLEEGRVSAVKVEGK